MDNEIDTLSSSDLSPLLLTDRTRPPSSSSPVPTESNLRKFRNGTHAARTLASALELRPSMEGHFTHVI